MAYLGELTSSTVGVFGCGKLASVQDEATKLRIWDRILYSYTNRLLTREGDKLILISALAHQNQMQGEYLARPWPKLG
jgi:hypothetical protein